MQVSENPWTAEQFYLYPKIHENSYSNHAMWYLYN